jgi:preprotein translocase subunit SecE
MRDKARDNAGGKVLDKNKDSKPREKEKARAGDDRPRRFSGVQRFVRETRSELKKVVWPSRETAINLTLIVAGVSLAVGIFLGLIDLALREFFKLIVGG